MKIFMNSQRERKCYWVCYVIVEMMGICWILRDGKLMGILNIQEYFSGIVKGIVKNLVIIINFV